MKKLIAVLLSLCLMMGAAAAFAAETTPRAVNWSDYHDKAAQTDGRFTNVTGTSLKMFIPSEFKPSELSDETYMAGTSMVLKSEKNDKVIVNAQTMDKDMDAFKAKMEKMGFNMSDDLTLNGRTVTQFSVSTADAKSICFASVNEAGKVQVISFSAADLNAYTELFRLMAASIQNADDAET